MSKQKRARPPVINSDSILQRHRRPAFLHAALVVETQKPGRCHSYPRHTLNSRPLETKMLVPSILTRMEQAGERTCLIKRTDVTAFVQVTKQTCQSEVVGSRRPAMLFTDDMVDLEAHIGIVLEHEAIFTTPAGARDNETPKFGSNVSLTHVRPRFWLSLLPAA